MKVRVLQIGAGSMGMRRLRDFTARGDVELALFDIRQDRRKRVENHFGIKTFEDFTMLWSES